MGSKYVIGIDLGTTKSVVAIYENGVPKIIENKMGKRITPSFVALKKGKKGAEDSWLIGDSAKNQAVINAANTVYDVKRLIGRRYDDPAVQKMQSLASYKIVKGPNGDAWVEIDGKAMAPAQISAMVLRELKEAVEKYLGKDENGKQIEVSDAVITCPAYFNDSQIKATKDAGEIAGLNVLRVIKEPTAAALAYGMDKKKSGKVIVYDLGGGTFDVSLLEVSIDEKEGNVVQVLSTNGDTFLGGENFDERIMDYLIEELKKETGLDLKAGKGENAVRALQQLKDASERAKIELSSQETVEINIPFIGKDKDGDDVNFEHTLTRNKLEQLVQDLIDKTKEPCRKALADAGLKAEDIDQILLVGAQTRMPKVVETVRNLFNKEPLQDVPVQEIVALGAAVQGAVLDGKVGNVLLLDVIPLTIGIKAANDVFAPIVPRNSTIPAEFKDVFSTAEDGQRNVEIKVYQGERAKASDNKLLGSFTLDGIPPAPKGKPQIEVTFNIDADGVLQVQAKDLLTGKAQKITVKANGGLSDAEVEKMLKDAEANAAADALFKARQAASYTADEQLKEAAADTAEEYFQAAPADLREAFELTVKELTEAVARKDVDVMLEKTARLKDVRSKIGEAFYDAAQQKNNTEEPPKNDGTTSQPEGPTP
jgi:molecular chaperone DnaK